MKRTRRVEVIRYSRRITVIDGESAAVDTAAEQEARDLILDVLADSPPTNEQDDLHDAVPGNARTDCPPRRRALMKLGDLLRLRGRT